MKIKNIETKAKIVIIFVLIILLGYGVYWCGQTHQSENYFEQRVQDGIIAARSPEEIQNLLNQTVGDGMFNISINTSPEFENGRSEGNLWIENIPANHYYSKVAIYLKESDELVLETKLIKPNQYIKKLKLDTELKKGKYDAIAKFTVIEPSTMQDIGATNVEISLTIIN